MIIFSDRQSVIKWTPATRNYYESLGYQFTSYYDEFYVYPEDLPEKSRIKVWVICPDCGNEREVTRASVGRNNSSTCQACANFNRLYVDLTGIKFGRLHVQYNTFEKSNNGKYIWRCLCDCGNSADVVSSALVTGNTTSCGCYALETKRESGRNLGLAQSGENHPNWNRVDLVCDNCGEIFQRQPNRIRSELVFCSTSCRNEYLLTGENNPNWNPDLTDIDRQSLRTTDEYRQLISFVLERDDYTCQVCGVRGTEMNVHHLYSFAAYPEYRLDPELCLTMCESEHMEFHSWMGGKRIPCTPDDFCDWLVTL